MRTGLIVSTARLEDVAINYRSVGEGRDIVLVHGLATNHAFWQIGVLLPLAREHRVTIFDLRGHGYSGMPSGGYTSRDMANDLHGLFDHLKIPRADLIGHSFGGVILLHFAIMYPERVASLTLVDTRLRILQPTNFPADWPQGERVLKKLAELGLSPPEGEKEAGLWLLEELASPKWRKARRKLEGTQLSIPFGSWNSSNRTAERWLKLLHNTTARQDFANPAGLTVEKLHIIKQPTFLICGEHSPTISTFTRLQEYLPHCKTAIVPGAGHFYPLTRPETFVDLVRQFLWEVGHQERRGHTRFSVQIPSVLRENLTQCSTGTTVNVSRKGLLLESPRQIAEGSILEVTLMGPEMQTIALKGKVVRMGKKDENGTYRIGIELFTEGERFHLWEKSLPY